MPIPPALHGRRATPSRRHPAPPQARGNGRQRRLAQNPCSRAQLGTQPEPRAPDLAFCDRPRLRLLAANGQQSAGIRNKQGSRQAPDSPPNDEESHKTELISDRVWRSQAQLELATLAWGAGVYQGWQAPPPGRASSRALVAPTGVRSGRANSCQQTKHSVWPLRDTVEEHTR